MRKSCKIMSTINISYLMYTSIKIKILSNGDYRENFKNTLSIVNINILGRQSSTRQLCKENKKHIYPLLEIASISSNKASSRSSAASSPVTPSNDSFLV